MGRHLHISRRFAYLFWIAGGFGLFMTVVIASLVVMGVEIEVNGRPAESRDAWVFLFLPLWALGFIAGGRYIWRMPQRAGKAAAFTAYALTTSRLLILDSDAKGVNRTVRRFGVTDVERIVRIERPNDEGDLILSEEKEQEFITGGGANAVMRPIGLMGIDRPAEVERLIRETLLGRKRGSD